MNAYEAYQRYLAFKQHFLTKNYDFFRYGGRVRSSIASFEKRKDRYYFHKLSKRPDIDGLLLAYFVESPIGSKGWIGDILESKDLYQRWLQRQESISYRFKNDLYRYVDDNLREAIAVREGQHPKMLVDYFRGHITIESLVILDSKLHILDIWDSKIEERLVWPGIYNKVKKYTPFVKWDKEKIRNILVDFTKEVMHTC